MNDVRKYIEENFPLTIRENKDDDGSLLGMPYPYNVSGIEKMFREMYYWGTYFTNVGLLLSGRENQAKNNVDNMLYLVEKYGFVPNANRSFYLNRSQPPFLFAMVNDIYNKFKDDKWLAEAYATLKKEYDFWQTRRKAENGLNYYGNKDGFEASVDTLCADFEKRTKGCFKDAGSEERYNIAGTVRTFVESGWDCTSRFEHDGLFYNPVDLNSLLYGFEKQMAVFSGILGAGEEKIWEDRATDRKEKMDKYLWNEKYGIYMDWNFKRKVFSPIRSIASLYPMYVKLDDNIDGAVKLLDDLMLEYGVSSALKDNCKDSMQWDYPIVWPPLQYLVFIGCRNYNLEDMARVIAEKYIKLTEKVFAETGALWEKFDGINGCPSSVDYEAPKMLGWSAGLYIFFTDYIG